MKKLFATEQKKTVLKLILSSFILLIICVLCTCVETRQPDVDKAYDNSISRSSFNDYETMSEVSNFDYEFLPASTNWNTLISDTEPARFDENKITYQLASNVLLVNHTVTDSIASAGQLIDGNIVQKLKPNRIIAEGGYIPMNILQAAAAEKGRTVNNGMIVINESTGTAFKVVSPTVYDGFFNVDSNLNNSVKLLEGNYSIIKPSLQDIITDFDFQEDTISLTRGNITEFAPDIEKNIMLSSYTKPMAFNDSMKDFKYLSDDPLIHLKFDNERLDAKLSEGTTVSVTISGGLGIDDIDLTARYSRSDGYKIAITLKQESYLVIELDATVKEEIRIPLFAIDIPFGIGRVSGGLYAIVGMDGTIKIEIEARECTTTKLGVRGSTKWYIPTSVHRIFENSLETDGEVDIAGDIDGYLKLGPMVGIEIFGFDLVGAGVHLGAGVHVDKVGKSLNVELYGIFDVYVKFNGKTYNLINYRPTILKRTQADTAGYKIKIMEAFVMPGRVGGTIQEEIDDPLDLDGYVGVEGIQYRILVVPDGVTFNPDNPSDLDNVKIRKYPSSGYALTNNEGEFIQKNDKILYAHDKAYLEFRVGNESYFSDPVDPKLPFEDIKLTNADYFNDYAVGQVMPVKVINWLTTDSDSPEDQFEWTYYKNALIHVTPYNSDITGGKAHCWTDEYGHFDTSIPFIFYGKEFPNSIDIKPIYREDIGIEVLHWTVFDLTIDCNDATMTKRIGNFSPTASFSFQRVVNEVKDSYERYMEDGKIVDRMAFDEHIIVTNLLGTRTVEDKDFYYSLFGFSTQDYLYRFSDSELSANLAAFTGNNMWETKPIIIPKADFATLVPILDTLGNPTGAAEFTQRIVVEWVWQNHPNPINITSDDNAIMIGTGGEFQVLAEGDGPFNYNLIGAENDIQIDYNTGLISVPNNIPEGVYTFIIRVSEAIIIMPIGASDPRSGNDLISCEQLFILTITNPGYGVGEAPVIAERTNGYNFSTLINGGDLVIDILLSSNSIEPSSYSIVMNKSNYQIPEKINIDPMTGIITVSEGLDIGTYYFAILVTNLYGGDIQNCSLDVIALSSILHDIYEEPINIIIRCDHKMDVYSNDSLDTNGAAYVKWDTFVGVKIEGIYISSEYDMVDHSPISDKYHFYEQIDIPNNVKEEILQSFQNQLSDYLYGEVFYGEKLNSENLLKEFNDFLINPLGESLFYMEYGSMLNDINNDKGGDFAVELGGGKGTIVTGKYFSALKNNKNGNLVFEQQGAIIAFKGRDILKETETDYEIFDFGYSDKAPHQAEMLSGLGEGAKSFTFGFNHHGELPGMASFSIETDISEGEKVNVYRFDSEVNKFTLIAEKLNVGKNGLVNYKNNTMSEYLITTETIEGALISDMVNQQGYESLIFKIILSLDIVLAAATITIIIIRKKKQSIKRHKI